MLLFIIYMIIWIFFGLAMIMTAKREGIKWYAIIFFIMAPFIPIVADFAGLV